MPISVFVNQIAHLKSLGLLITTSPFYSSSFIGNLTLTPLGQKLYDLLDLNLIEDKDLEDFRDIMNAINK